ncbi:hypothetical protein M569_04964 [Genlisea aurea]|uniref:Thaumatin-like protein n=1 Tax=Genlisea aurea TaxID=192259 RepID=S8EB66_9LAMI|nr:hypothetical protein M569_04964 [Genlisea aurea]
MTALKRRVVPFISVSRFASGPGKETLWPGILSGGGSPLLMNGRPRASSVSLSRSGNCTTGNCSGRLECSGTGGAPPAKFTLNSSAEDFYDVSLVDGFNVPVSILTSSGNCSAVNCTADVNLDCPPELQVVKDGAVVACKSACLAFDWLQYCCTGDYNNPQVCKAD